MKLSKRPPITPLTRNERDSLFFLVYLYLRIGNIRDAELILENLKQFMPEEPRTARYLAAIALEKEDGRKALAHLKDCLDRSEIKSEDAPLLLMQARALWLLGQETESRRVLSEYLIMTGDTTS
jgi:predicted Zn-dependent protease